MVTSASVPFGQIVLGPLCTIPPPLTVAVGGAIIWVVPVETIFPQGNGAIPFSVKVIEPAVISALLNVYCVFAVEVLEKVK